MARICFGVSSKDLGRIPVMLSIPGTYSVGHQVTRRRGVRLVSLKQAKELGIAVQRSQEAMSNFVTSKNAGKITARQSSILPWLTKPSSKIPAYNSGMGADVPADRFCGMAATGFPSLRRNNVLENGLWCFGCRCNHEKYPQTRELNSDIELSVSPFHLDEFLLIFKKSSWI